MTPRDLPESTLLVIVEWARRRKQGARLPRIIYQRDQLYLAEDAHWGREQRRKVTEQELREILDSADKAPAAGKAKV